MTNLIFFGKNYQDHMHELGDKPVDKTVIFLKPENIMRACHHWGESLDLYFPEAEIQQEVELVFKLTAGGFQMTSEQARDALGSYTVGLDMTKRSLQKQLKDCGHPWTSVNNITDCLLQPFSFFLNSDKRQASVGNNMIFSPIDLIVQASHYFPLFSGDILFTGTPSGVGNIARGDVGRVTLGDDFYQVKWSR